MIYDQENIQHNSHPEGWLLLFGVNAGNRTQITGSTNQRSTIELQTPEHKTTTSCSNQLSYDQP